MLVTGIIGATGFVVLGAKFSRNTIEKVLGYDYVIDVVVTVGLPVLLASTYAGAMMAVTTGIFISAILFVAKKTLGYQKREGGKWVRYPGKWTAKSCAEKVASKCSVAAIGEFKSNILDGWNKGKAKAAKKKSKSKK